MQFTPLNSCEKWTIKNRAGPLHCSCWLSENGPIETMKPPIKRIHVLSYNSYYMVIIKIIGVKIKQFCGWRQVNFAVHNQNLLFLKSLVKTCSK